MKKTLIFWQYIQKMKMYKERVVPFCAIGYNGVAAYDGGQDWALSGKGGAGMGGGNIYERIAAQYNQLSRAERRIANYVLKYRHMMQPVTSAQMAKECGVSVASVTRFCRAIGLENFAQFKWSVSAALASAAAAGGAAGDGGEIDAYDEIRPEDSIELKCQKLSRIGAQALAQTLEKIDPEAIRSAVELLCRARGVYCFGQGNSSIVASDAWGRFASVSSKFHWVGDSHMQAYTAALLRRDDVVLYFSFSGATKELCELGQLLKQAEAKLILVTRFPNSPGALLADLVLLCGVNETPRQQGSIAAKIGQLFIVDVLFNEYCAQNLDSIIENQKKTASATEARHFCSGRGGPGGTI